MSRVEMSCSVSSPRGRHHHHVLHAHEVLAVHPQARLHGQGHAVPEDGVTALAQTRRLVDVHTHAVPQPVDELLAPPRILEDLAGRRVGLRAGGLVGPHHLHGRALRVGHQQVVVDASSGPARLCTRSVRNRSTSPCRPLRNRRQERCPESARRSLLPGPRTRAWGNPGVPSPAARASNMVLKHGPSAPCLTIWRSISRITSATASPGRNVPTTSRNTLSVIRQASRISSISSGSRIARSGSMNVSVLTKRMCG